MADSQTWHSHFEFTGLASQQRNPLVCNAMPSRFHATLQRFQRCCVLAVLTLTGQAALAAESVTMYFDWPDGLQAKVEASIVSALVRSQAKIPAGQTAEFNMVYRKVNDDEQHLTFDKYMFFHQKTAPSVGAPGGLARKVTLAVDQHRFSKLLDPEPLHKALSEAILASVPPQVMQIPSLRNDIVAEASVASLNQRFSQLWYHLVETWQGQELGPGESHSQDEEGELVPNLTRKVRANFILEMAREQPPCQRSGIAKQCAELTIRADITPENFTESAAAILRSKLPENAAQIAVSSASMVLEVKLITEPKGLIPHKLTEKMIVKMSVQAEKNPTVHHLEMIQQDQYVFSY